MDKAQKDISVTLDKLMKQQQQMQATLLDLEDSQARKGWKQYRREADREDRLLELLGGVFAHHSVSMPMSRPPSHHPMLPLDRLITPQFMHMPAPSSHLLLSSVIWHPEYVPLFT